MPFIRKSKPPAAAGTGRLRFHGFEGPVSYELAQSPAQLRAGPKGIRGSFRADAEVAARAFQAGDGFLVLEDGAEFRLKVLAHTAGTATAYFEMWR